jgi:alkylated DNA nucleotide flippase Atl1
VASVRAENVAEVLWELKRIDKVATFTEVATRAGFKPGAGGRTLLTCLATVQRDWPHLQWWRTIPDDGCIAQDSPHAEQLKNVGFELEPAGRKGFVTIADLASRLFTWEVETPEVAEVVA